MTEQIHPIPKDQMASDFELRADNICIALSAARHRIENYGYDHKPADIAISALRATFITWLVACEEARAQDRLGNSKANFVDSVLELLPIADDPSWPNFIEPPPLSSLRHRLEALWGIRIAYTHSDGNVMKIASEKNRKFAIQAPLHLPGTSLIGNWLDVSKCDLHTVKRSIIQVRSILQ
jgi:hypothetical protein